MLLGGVLGMLPREIVKIWALRYAISCIFVTFMIRLWYIYEPIFNCYQ